MNRKKIKIITMGLLGILLIPSTLVSAKEVTSFGNRGISSYEQMMLEVANTRRLEISKLPSLSKSEIDNLKHIASNNDNFKLLVDELYNSGINNTKNYNVKYSNKITGDDYELSTIIFYSEKASIIFMKLGNEYNSYAMIPIEKQNEIFINMYNIEDNSLNLLDKIKYDKQSSKSLKVTVPKRAFKLVIHGNWCGPGHSGPEAPIDNIDACCQKHDYCYDRMSGNDGKKNCDMELVSCVNSLYKQSSIREKALINAIAGYFMWVNSEPNL
ncbi:hypothetical protein N072000002_04420 [Clostridium tetani]|uniref:Phospholipase A2-like central domain-containing protein n=2 Tax=Clostridium tetani TaxID=1513 RepID=A0ABC8EDL9_CLOTA|nr:phospholipase A2 family protein [Clostridium tetani]BDR80192.1 hypothetical protein K234311028_04380 [Clostridium tetani]BDR88641.1 hypothetical protein N072000002_04420 [Clostridium tetani]